MQKIPARFLLLTTIFLLVFTMAGCAGQDTGAQQENAATSSPGAADTKTTGLPQMMTWSAYDVGAAGYTQTAAIANALSKEYGTQVRILPSGTSVGRMTTLRTGAATYGFLADEVAFATEALYEFAGYNWGPQDLRVVLNHPTACALATAADANIKTLADLKDKRVAYVVGAPTLYVKTEAFMAFAGLTWDDVQKVEMPSYAASLKAMIEDKVDAALVIPTAPTLYELAASPRGLYWPEFPASDTEGWARLQKVAPWLSPGRDDRAAGLEKGEFKEFPVYGFPQLTTYASTNADEVYALIKAIDDTYELYKDADPLMPDWAVEKSGKPPAGAPFHEGAIRYLREKGIWADADEAWNSQALERLAKVQGAWQQVLDEATSQGIAENDFPAYWLERKAELLGEST